MNSRSTYLEQDLVNIIASMTLNIPNYPRQLYEAGYRIEYTEKEFDVTQNGKPVEVKFDLVLNNIDKNHSLSFECKSGKTEAKQLKKYSNLSSQEMVSVGGISSNNTSSHTHDIVLVYNDCHKQDILQEASSYNFVHIPITYSPTYISKEGKPFEDDDLDIFFQSSIEYPDLVHEVFAVGGQTPESKYMMLIATILVTFSIEGKDSFTIADIAPSVVSHYPGLYPSRIGLRLRKEIERKIDRVLDEGSKYELKDYIEWNRTTKEGKLRALKKGCKPIKYKMFKDLALEVSERYRTGSPVPDKYISKQEKAHKNQLVLEDYDYPRESVVDL